MLVQECSEHRTELTGSGNTRKVFPPSVSASSAPHLLLLRGQMWLAQGCGASLDLQALLPLPPSRIASAISLTSCWLSSLACSCSRHCAIGEFIISLLPSKALRGSLGFPNQVEVILHKTLRLGPSALPRLLLSSQNSAVRSLGTHPVPFTCTLASAAQDLTQEPRTTDNLPGPQDSRQPASAH